MIPITSFRDRKVMVFGLGRSGVAAARALMAGGALVHAWDDDEACLSHAENLGLPLADPNRMDWQEFAALVLSPGIPHTHPKPNRIVQMAQMVGVPILGDIELFAGAVNDLPENRRPRIVGITGTNGKSTTSSLIGHILRQASCDVRVGGNIGTGVLDLDDFRVGSVYVLELSSYQLELTRNLRCDVAVFLNLSPDHLDRHGGMAGYRAAKMRIFANQRREDWAVVGCDDKATRVICTQMMQRADRQLVKISSTMALPGSVSVSGGFLHDDIARGDQATLKIKDLRALKGEHNLQNAAAAYAVCRALKIDRHRVLEGMSGFVGLPHRLEAIGEFDGVFFVNDSKATNAHSARHALRAYPGAYWIAGGRAKEDGIEAIRDELPKISGAYLIGEAAESFGRQIGSAADWRICDTLEAAVTAAHADARSDGKERPVVLLSPACASFDQFAGFERRGQAFREAVHRLDRRSAA